jgi:hypothetical protein
MVRDRRDTSPRREKVMGNSSKQRNGQAQIIVPAPGSYATAGPQARRHRRAATIAPGPAESGPLETALRTGRRTGLAAERSRRRPPVCRVVPWPPPAVVGLQEADRPARARRHAGQQPVQIAQDQGGRHDPLAEQHAGQVKLQRNIQRRAARRCQPGCHQAHHALLQVGARAHAFQHQPEAAGPMRPAGSESRTTRCSLMTARSRHCSAISSP